MALEHFASTTCSPLLRTLRALLRALNCAPGLWLGTQYARAGSVRKTADILEKVRPFASS
jgi:hypothetical protein